MTPTRILAATDLSEASDEALRHACAAAKASGAKLAICHVMPYTLGLHPLFPQQNQASVLQMAEFEAKVQDLVGERLATIEGAPEDAEIFVEQGTEYAGIIHRAEAWKADRIVVGSHGRTGLKRTLLGSVAEQVVRYAHCPVYVARPHTKHGVVMVATDLSNPSLPAVAAGADEAKQRGAKLLLVHAIDFSAATLTAAAANPLGVIPVLPPPEVQKQLGDATETMLREALQRFGATGEVKVLTGPPPAAIVKYADEVGAELVVVATRGRTGLSRIALGSVAARVIRMAASSVLAVRLPT